MSRIIIEPLAAVRPPMLGGESMRLPSFRDDLGSIYPPCITREVDVLQTPLAQAEEDIYFMVGEDNQIGTPDMILGKVSANGWQSCPGGLLIEHQRAGMIVTRPGATERWFISGITKDGNGAALGGCRVVVLDTGLIAVGQAQAVVGETISDGSGAYSIEVAQNCLYWLIAYLPGSPDRAGATVQNVVPVQV